MHSEAVACRGVCLFFAIVAQRTPLSAHASECTCVPVRVCACVRAKLDSAERVEPLARHRQANLSLSLSDVS